MKVAQHPDTHQPLPAAAEAPTQAFCPTCGGVVTLRLRRRMDGAYARGDGLHNDTPAIQAALDAAVVRHRPLSAQL